MSIEYFLLVFLSYLSLHHLHQSSASPTPLLQSKSRRALHRHFFPLTSTAFPPSQPPSPSFPKYPSSSSSSNVRPFFPLYPSPPPPPPRPPALSSTTSLPTFPANVPPSRHSPPKLFLLIALPVLALAILGSSVSLFLVLLRRRRGSAAYKDGRSDSLRFLPPEAAAFDGDKRSAAPSAAPSAAAGSEFLYLGTLVNSRGHTSGSSSSAGANAEAQQAAGGGSPNRKIGSPELRPLPPLPRQIRSGEIGCRPSSGEHYSPNAFGMAGIGAAFSSKISYLDEKTERFEARGSTLGTQKNLSSIAAGSPPPPAPTSASVTQVKPPPPVLRAPTPSPPKRRPRFHSPPTSPSQGVDNHRKMETLRASCRNSWSPRNIGDFARSQFAVSWNPPPLQPPPLPHRYNEGQNSQRWSRKPSVPSSPEAIGVRNPPAAAVFPVELPKSSDASEKFKLENPRPKVKPLHWDKVRASFDHGILFDQLKSISFQLNGEMIKTFSVFDTKRTSMEPRKLSPSSCQEDRFLDPKKFEDIASLLRRLSITQEEVCDALLEGKIDSLSGELLEALAEIVPDREILEWKKYEDDEQIKLDPAESFLREVLRVPFAFKRVDAMLYIINFDSEVTRLNNLFGILEAACDELRSNITFQNIQGAILKIESIMNAGKSSDDKKAFQLDTLAKLTNIKETDAKTRFLRSFLQEILRVESSFLCSSIKMMKDDESRKSILQVLSRLWNELPNAKKAATMDLDALSSYIWKLSSGIGLVQEVLRLNDEIPNKSGGIFHNSMVNFLKRLQDKLLDIQERESSIFSLVKETTEHLNGELVKEGHTSNIFMEVIGFLNDLNQVFKEAEILSNNDKEQQSDLPQNLTSPAASQMLNAGKLENPVPGSLPSFWSPLVEV